MLKNSLITNQKIVVARGLAPEHKLLIKDQLS